MKLVAQLKLLPSSEQEEALKRTLEATNAACNYISSIAWDNQVFRKFALQKLCYNTVRERFGLSAQLTIRALAKVADAYKHDKRTRRTFRSDGGIAYDDRILSFNLIGSEISIWTLEGRQSLTFVCGDHHHQILASQKGESDLLFRNNSWYLLATCEIEPAELHEAGDVLGVDLGVTNIAVDSDGTIYNAAMVNNVRYRHRRLRDKLQRKGTLSAKRRLRKLRDQEQRFAKDVNHTISKRLVEQAERTKRAIALENLKGIRTRVRARRSQRAQLHSWSFRQLQTFIGYKAHRKGVILVFVDPRNTSRRCPACGYTDKANRLSQAAFQCMSCGCAGHADIIAAENIRVLGRAAVMQPHASEVALPSGQRQACIV